MAARGETSCLGMVGQYKVPYSQWDYNIGVVKWCITEDVVLGVANLECKVWMENVRTGTVQRINAATGVMAMFV